MNIKYNELILIDKFINLVLKVTGYNLIKMIIVKGLFSHTIF